jgi:hypothetical protein
MTCVEKTVKFGLERMQHTLAHVQEIARERLRAMVRERHTPDQDRQQRHERQQGPSLSL